MFHAAIVSMPKFSAYSTSKHALHGENNMTLQYLHNLWPVKTVVKYGAYLCQMYINFIYAEPHL